MNIRAFLYDLARNQEVRPAYLKSMIERLAGLGFNMLVINLEHRFHFVSCPGLAPPGSLTAAGARALVQHGKKFGVEVVAQPNFIGHCEGWSALERYAHLSCDPWLQTGWGGYEQINFTLPETRDLVTLMLAEVCEAFPGRYLHIGADEIRRMAYIHPTEEARREPELHNQLATLLSMAGKHGRQLLMWGDMLLAHPALRSLIPKDMIVCDWHYEEQGSRETLVQLRDEGFPVLATPAVSTCYSFLSDPIESFGNIRRMITDAKELALEGFLLTSWHFSAGSSYDLIWPWVAFAGEVAAGKPHRGWKPWLSHYFKNRHGGNGTDFARLHDLLHGQLTSLIGGPERLNVHLKLARLRYGLFRGAEFSSAPARIAPVPESTHQTIWEPSPFQVWLTLRPILNGSRRRKFRKLAGDVKAAASGVKRAAVRNKQELLSYIALARAFEILVLRIELIEQARESYHEASLAQPGDIQIFKRKIVETIRLLEKIRPGIRELRRLSRRLAAHTGIDIEETKWLDIHEKSLNEHLSALRSMPFAGNALLEFGEFLRRPAHISQRVPWR